MSDCVLELSIVAWVNSLMWTCAIGPLHHLISVCHLLIGQTWRQLTSPLGNIFDWVTPEFRHYAFIVQTYLIGLGTTLGLLTCAMGVQVEVASPFCLRASRSSFVEFSTGLLISFIIFLDGASPYFTYLWCLPVPQSFLVFSWDGPSLYFLVSEDRFRSFDHSLWNTILKSRVCSLCQSTECVFIRRASIEFHFSEY